MQGQTSNQSQIDGSEKNTTRFEKDFRDATFLHEKLRHAQRMLLPSSKLWEAVKRRERIDMCVSYLQAIEHQLPLLDGVAYDCYLAHLDWCIDRAKTLRSDLLNFEKSLEKARVVLEQIEDHSSVSSTQEGSNEALIGYVKELKEGNNHIRDVLQSSLKEILRDKLRECTELRRLVESWLRVSEIYRWTVFLRDRVAAWGRTPDANSWAESKLLCDELSKIQRISASDLGCAGLKSSIKNLYERIATLEHFVKEGKNTKKLRRKRLGLFKQNVRSLPVVAIDIEKILTATLRESFERYGRGVLGRQ